MSAVVHEHTPIAANGDATPQAHEPPAQPFAVANTATLFLLFLTFLLLGIGNSGAHTTVIHWGGYLGLATAAGAAYVALSEVLAEMYGKSILPVRPL